MFYDQRQLEIVVQFSSLLNLLADPEALKKLLENASAVLEENRALAGPIRTKELADEYLAKAKAAEEEALVEAEKTKTAAKESADALKEKMAKQQDVINTVQSKTDALKQEVGQLQEELVKNKNESIRLIQENVKALEESLASKQEYDRLSAELQEKIAKLNAALGI